MKPRETHTRNEGFTLIEVVVALTVLSIGVLAANIMQVDAIKGNTTAEVLTTATAAAADMTERIAGLPFDAGTNGTDDDGDGLADEPDEDILNAANSPYTLAALAANGVDDDGDGNIDEADEGDSPGYLISWTVQDDTPIANTKRIIVTVNARTPMGQKTVSLNCLKIR